MSLQKHPGAGNCLAVAFNCNAFEALGLGRGPPLSPWNMDLVS